MAATATMLHDGYRAMDSLLQVQQVRSAQQQQDTQQDVSDELIPPMYCRALYDYRSNDSSSLTFYRGDIIEVLTQLDSGWWDGLLNEERGWFPSNYVETIAVEEIDAELVPLPSAGVHDSAIDVSQDVRAENVEHEQEWLQEDMEHIQNRGGFEDHVNGAGRAPGASNDFWLPRVDQNGQIYYLNTQTGERSRDLPNELGEDSGGSDLAEYSSTANSRAVSRAGHATSTSAGRSDSISAPSASRAASGQAGFGIAKRSGTPEPWTKRLADDGMTYYYFNKLTGQIQWTRPVAESGARSTSNPVAYQEDARQNGQRAPVNISSAASGYTSQASTNDTLFASSRLRADSVTSQNHASSKRESVYSDDSDIQPREMEGLPRTVKSSEPGANGVIAHGDGYDGDLTLTPAERSASLLQLSLTPPDPETVDSLSDITHEAIIAVMASVDDNGLPKGQDHDKEVESNVLTVVVAVRNLLYVSCALSGQLPNNLGERSQGDPAATAVAQQLQAQLRVSQRKVTATLSKLVLSARAACYKREPYSSEMMIRVEQDAADLQRAIDKFVAEVKKQYARTVIKQMHQRVGRKRLRGVFGLNGLGLGLPGAGAAASWKGFGFANLDEGVEQPKRSLNEEAISEARALLRGLCEELAHFLESVLDPEISSDDLLPYAQAVLAQISAFADFFEDINVSQEVDVFGLREGEPSASDDPYLQAVLRARSLLRRLEAVVQSLYDDSASLLVFVQSISYATITWSEAAASRLMTALENSTVVVKVEAEKAIESLEYLLLVAREQIASEGRYRESMALRLSRISMIDGSNRLSNFFGSLPPDEIDEGEDVVDMDFAFRKGALRPAMAPVDGYIDPVGVIDPGTHQEISHNRTRSDTQKSSHRTQLSGSLPPPAGEVSVEDDIVGDLQDKADKGAAPTRATKIRQLLGPDAPERYIEIANADQKPWYLRSEFSKEELIINPDGGVRAGTLPALIERLTTHEYGEPIFIRTFLMTYKTFTTVNELFELLVKRYRILPPEGLSSTELEDWTKLKQHVVRSRVLNTFKTLIMDDQVLLEDDLFILDRIKEFLSDPEVSQVPAAKTLLNVVERKKQGGTKTLTVTPPTTFPPPSIIPKGMNKNKLKLLDIDPLEIARQLTIMESALYRKIKAIECLQRSREQKVGDNRDHITDVIQMTNKIANWVNSTILSKEDSRKRAALVKQFISIADRCRNLNNFSSMAAIISGLNSPPIRRLKRTWEQVSGRFMSQLGTCEMTLDSTKNFTNYKATLAQTSPPCIPFIGVYLTTLTFIQDGGKDTLPGNLINFGKRQRAAEIIREIQNWQTKDFNLAPLPPILAFIEEALGSFSDSVDWGEQFWNLSLEREPREREDEKMARLLQESGFL